MKTSDFLGKIRYFQKYSVAIRLYSAKEFIFTPIFSIKVATVRVSTLAV